MKGLNFSAILGIYIPISFYCCLSGTILILVLLPLSIKRTRLKRPLKKLATIFVILWVINIILTLVYSFLI